MPLRDHFRAPLRGDLRWSSFLCAWSSFTAFRLNTTLPHDFRAVPNVRAATETYHDETHAPITRATLSVPFELAGETAEVLVHGHRDGRYLAAVIALVSEGNEDRESFIAKCETYIQSGAGLVIVDLVTTRTTNFHDELMARVGPPDYVAWGERLYATAYRASGKNGSGQLTVWQETLALGSSLPTMPLWCVTARRSQWIWKRPMRRRSVSSGCRPRSRDAGRSRFGSAVFVIRAE